MRSSHGGINDVPTYRQLLQKKREAFWQHKVTADRLSPRQLLRSVDELMCRGLVPPSSAVDVDDIHRFFDDKMAAVRASTTDATPPTFSTVPIGCVLRCFRPLTTVDVIAAVHLLPDKQCTSDPLPTRLLKDIIDLLAPFLVELFSHSLQQGVVPFVSKEAFITPLLKKADLDPADVTSYRSISNLSVLFRSCLRD